MYLSWAQEGEKERQTINLHSVSDIKILGS